MAHIDRSVLPILNASPSLLVELSSDNDPSAELVLRARGCMVQQRNPISAMLTLSKLSELLEISNNA